ncbi:MAG TPA: DUF2795 domain-containing protein [Mycetocola sp.]|jgi:hypothetical protein|uniref:DUF2795 domain-containing protein n=1 Tax=Mycetocola sp. TaxID=1871042 RepID=UPI00261981BA|nr:DUF2795 domain-containing protein [Mycetocola sp.]MCU1559623.1 uncharacterized protein [Mycetocola sp.]HEV7848673.1 DUF2795 domain-containing protein [Mycetocola sp.]
MSNGPSPIDLQKALGGMEYPASKDDILRRARENGADDDVMSALGRIDDRSYDGPTGVSEAVSF